MKKVFTMLGVVALIFALNTGSSFADTNTKAGSSGANTVPANLSIAATTIDFNISENITLTGVANSVTLTCTDLEVVNNLNAGAIQVTSLSASAATNWTLVASSTNFAALPLNSNQIGLKCEGVDLYNSTYGPTAAIEPQKSLKIKFEAKTNAVSTELTDVKVAEVVATVAMVDTTSSVPSPQ